MLLQPILNRKAGYSSIMNECCSETISILYDAMQKIVDALLTLTFELTSETYQQSFGARQLYIKYIQSFLAASIPFVCIIIRIQNLQDISVCEPTIYMSSA